MILFATEAYRSVKVLLGLIILYNSMPFRQLTPQAAARLVRSWPPARDRVEGHGGAFR
jgi:hypothetical protein